MGGRLFHTRVVESGNKKGGLGDRACAIRTLCWWSLLLVSEFELLAALVACCNLVVGIVDCFHKECEDVLGLMVSV